MHHITSETTPHHISATPTASLLTRQDVALALATCLRTVDENIASGSLEIVRIGRAVRVRPSSLEKFIEARTTRCNPRQAARKKVAPASVLKMSEKEGNKS